MTYRRWTWYTSLVTTVAASVVCLAPGVTILVEASLSFSKNNGGQSTSSYVSTRALDRYGSAVQVGHAAEAAQRHGRLVVAAVVRQSHPTIHPDKDNDDTRDETSSQSSSSSTSSFLVVVSVGKTPVLQPIQLPLADGEQGFGCNKLQSQLLLVALCCTGVRGDARWLTAQIRSHLSNLWDRYDTAMPTAAAVAHAVTRLMGRFMGHDETQEWQSAVGGPAPVRRQGDDEMEQSMWARPLGVRTMILSTYMDPSSSVSLGSSVPGLLLVEPSGRILTPHAQSSSGKVSMAAMGKESEKVHGRLRKLLENGQERTASLSSSWEEVPPTLEECRQCLIDIVMDEVVFAGDGTTRQSQSSPFSKPAGLFQMIRNRRGSGLEGGLMVEIFSSDRGILEQQRVPYNKWRSS